MAVASGWEAASARAWLEAALHAPPASPAELLYVRDAAGHSLRPFAPPPGVIAREGAVLLLFYPDLADVRLPLIVRSAQLTHHRGEIGLPGGGVEPADADRSATALRECNEELGVPPDSVTVLGSLPPIYIAPSNYQIAPIVGWCAAPPPLVPNPAEVDGVLVTSLRALLAPDAVQLEQRTLRGVDVQVPYFAVAGYQVWGATALILSELLARLRRTPFPRAI